MLINAIEIILRLLPVHLSLLSSSKNRTFSICITAFPLPRRAQDTARDIRTMDERARGRMDAFWPDVHAYWANAGLLLL